MNLSTHFCHLASCRACEIFSLSAMVSSWLNGYFYRQANKSQSFVSSFFFYPNVVQCVNLRHFHLVTSLFTYFISKYSPGALVIQLFTQATQSTLHFCHSRRADVQSARELSIVLYVLYQGAHTHALAHAFSVTVANRCDFHSLVRWQTEVADEGMSCMFLHNLSHHITGNREGGSSVSLSLVRTKCQHLD